MSLFNSVRNNAPGRSVHNLSYEKKFTTDMGLLIPIMCDEMVPGDVWQIAHELLVRTFPLVAPPMHEINIIIHDFFVPYRILWDEWEDFITGGPTGSSAAVLPLWNPTNTAKGSLWDFLGMPVGVDPDGAYPLDFIRRAYAKIYNDFYRDETLISEVAATNEDILRSAWEKDYFTSALTNQQRGTAPALPVTGTTSATWATPVTVDWPAVGGSTGTAPQRSNTGTPNVPYDAGTKAFLENNTVNDAELENNVVDLSSATTFDVSDLRLAVQIQRWLERNNRAGARYTEFLPAHFGVGPRDDRLQRPEFIGGMKAPLIMSEVLQTSESATTPQGTLAGHGISVNRQYIGKYRCVEFGLAMSIMKIVPRPAYQQGIDRQWLRRTKYDFYFPEFANLSEQAIERAEIYASNVSAENTTIFGYQGRYDEMRFKRNMVCSEMRDTFDYWHLGRVFGSAPLLNQSFIECNPDKRIFAVENEDGFLVNAANIIKAVRPIPIRSEPGLMDH